MGLVENTYFCDFVRGGSGRGPGVSGQRTARGFTAGLLAITRLTHSFWHRACAWTSAGAWIFLVFLAFPFIAPVLRDLVALFQIIPSSSTTCSPAPTTAILLVTALTFSGVMRRGRRVLRHYEKPAVWQRPESGTDGADIAVDADGADTAREVPLDGVDGGT